MTWILKMLRKLKINTALIICVAFLFRLFTLNAGFISALDDQQNIHAKGYYALITKKEIIHVEPVTDSKVSYSDLEFSEEDSDENEFKIYTSLLLESFYAPIQHSVIKQIAVITPSNKHYISSSSQRHLEFGVFRI